MNKKKNWLFMLLWLLVAATSRIQYFIFGGQSIVDTYAYFSYAITRAEKQEPVLNPGLSYAFTKGLSRLLWFTGNLIEAVGIYQLLIQILWIVLLLIGISMLLGRIAGFVSSGILIVSPWILKSVFSVSPENYFMLYFSVLLVALGYFHVRVVKGNWRRGVWGRLYLKAVGFFVGMICIWNYLGWILFAMMVYVLISHFNLLKDKIRQQRQEKNLKEKKRIMSAGSQLFHLLIGWLVGSYATLMKYTGLTGNTLKEQFRWWISQFKDFPGRCQDVSIAFSIWLAGAVLAGVLCQLAYHIVKAKKTNGAEKEQETEIAQDAEEIREAEALQELGEFCEAEAVQDAEEVREAEAAQDLEEIREVEDALNMEEVQKTEAVLPAEEIREIETVQTVEEVQEVEAWQKEVQKVEMMQEAENDLKSQAGQNLGTEIYRRPMRNPETEIYRRPVRNPGTKIYMKPEENQETEIYRKPEENQEKESYRKLEENQKKESYRKPEENQKKESYMKPEENQKKGSHRRPEEDQEKKVYRKPEQETDRKVQFLENPLPVPKKHVRKDMEFDFDEVKMDFDIDIGENDDFDI